MATSHIESRGRKRKGFPLLKWRALLFCINFPDGCRISAWWQRYLSVSRVKCRFAFSVKLSPYRPLSAWPRCGNKFSTVTAPRGALQALAHRSERRIRLIMYADYQFPAAASAAWGCCSLLELIYLKAFIIISSDSNKCGWFTNFLLFNV